MRRGVNPRYVAAKDILRYAENREQLMEWEAERHTNTIAAGIGEALRGIKDAVAAGVAEAFG